MNDKFVELLKSKVNSGELKTKEEIIDYIKKIREIAYSNQELMQLLKEAGINLDEQDLNKVTTVILDYYDKRNANTTNLNLDGISQFKVKDEKGFDDKYIKIENNDGSYTVLEDNMTDKDLITQFNEKQNSSIDLQGDDGLKNREAIIKDMKENDKIEVNLQSANNVDIRELTPEERREFSAIMQGRNADEINFVVDTKRNIYIDKDTGDTYYTYINTDGKMEVRKAMEQGANNVSNEDGKKKDQVMYNDNNLDVNQLNDSDLQYVLDNKFDSLTPEQKQTLLAIAERRKEMKSVENTKDLTKEKGYQYVLKLNEPPKSNGYLNAILLSLITMSFGVAFIIFLKLISG